MKKKLIRITTVSISLDKLLPGQLSFLSEHYEVVGAASDTGELNDVSIREKIRTIDVKMQREISVFSDIKSLFNLIRLFKKEKPFIVHANTPKASLLSMIAAKISRVPHRIYTATGLRFETTKGLTRKILIAMEKLTCSCATKIIPESNGVRNGLLKNKITKKPLQIIGNGNVNGIDVEYFSRNKIDYKNLRNELNITADDIVYGFVGRIVADKGITELIDAFVEINKINSKTKLLLVGNMEEKLDPLPKSTMEKINSMRENIILCGFQKDVRPYLAICDVFVFPSYREGFPNVVLQAGAMNLPCIVTDINGSNEIIEDNKNGFIIPVQNTERLIETMTQIQNTELRQQMSEVARKIIVDKYTCEYLWNELLKMYQSLEK